MAAHSSSEGQGQGQGPVKPAHDCDICRRNAEVGQDVSPKEEQFSYIRNRMFRKILTKLVSPEYRPHGGVPTSERFRYAFDFQRQVLGDQLSAKIILNDKDEEMRAFLDQCDDSVAQPCRLLANACMSAMLHLCVSTTSINGFLGRGQMYIFSRPQIEKHLYAGQQGRAVEFRSLLDIGAGDGNVTAKIEPMINGKIFATETSPVMQWRLSRRGYTCLGIDNWQRSKIDRANGESKYDAIACLNVLDRCDRPRQLLEQIRDSVTPGTGRVIIAVVLPFKPSVEVGSKWVKPKESLGVRGFGVHEQTRSFALDVFEPMGFKVEAVSRAPYLCQGDALQPYYLLDDFIFSLSVPHNVIGSMFDKL